MDLTKNPIDIQDYSEEFLRAINNHIEYFGIELLIFRAGIVNNDDKYNRYQFTVDKRRGYAAPEEIKAIVEFPGERPRTTVGDNIYQETVNKHIPSFFRTTDAVKVHDLVALGYKVLKQGIEIEYTEKFVLMEVAEIIDYGVKFTNQLMYKLTMARDKDLIAAIKAHKWGGGTAYGGTSEYGGGGETT